MKRLWMAAAVLAMATALTATLPAAAHAESAPVGTRFWAGGVQYRVTAAGAVEVTEGWYEGMVPCPVEVVIPSSVSDGAGDYAVTSIGSDAFTYSYLLESVTIPDGVTAIGKYAFCGCPSLTSANIPDSVTSIGEYAFQGCSSLTSVTIPPLVNSLGAHVLAGCSSLASITLPPALTSIGPGAFFGCQSLVSATVPDSVTFIGNAAFFGCSSLKSITIPPAVTSLQPSTFSCCSSLTSITLPLGLGSIGDSALLNCPSLTSANIPDSVTSIGELAFYGCHQLEPMRLPPSLGSIGDYAFIWCRSDLIESMPGTTVALAPQALASLRFPIESSAIAGVGSHYVYDGRAIRPVPTVSLSGRDLLESSACSVTYEGDSSPGTATVIISGIEGGGPGGCSIEGTITRDYVIEPGLDAATATILVGESSTLAFVGGTGPVIWSSSNRAVVSVSDAGLVRGLAGGRATITAVRDGLRRTCVITVKKRTYRMSFYGLKGSGKCYLKVIARDYRGNPIRYRRVKFYRSGVYLGSAKTNAYGNVKFVVPRKTSRVYEAVLAADSRHSAGVAQRTIAFR